MKKIILVSGLVGMLMGSGANASLTPSYSQFYEDLISINKIFNSVDEFVNDTENTPFNRNSMMQYFDTKREAYVVQVDANGFDKDEIKISLRTRVMQIVGQSKKKSKNSDSNKYFSYIVTLPQDGKLGGISTEWKNGMLFVVVPKADKPQSDIKSIEIK